MAGRKIRQGFWANDPETLVPTYYGPEDPGGTSRYGGDEVPEGLSVGDHVYDAPDTDPADDGEPADVGLGGVDSNPPVGPDAGDNSGGTGAFDPSVKQPDADSGAVDAPEGPDAGLYDPAAHTVAEVVEYLQGADDAERARVLAAESAEGGHDRSGVTGWKPKVS